MAKTQLPSNSMTRKSQGSEDVLCVLLDAQSIVRTLILIQEAYYKESQYQDQALCFLINKLADYIDRAEALITGKS